MKKDGAPEYIKTANHWPHDGEKKQLLQMAEVHQVLRTLQGKKEDKFKMPTSEDKKKRRLKVTMRPHPGLPPTPFIAQRYLSPHTTASGAGAHVTVTKLKRRLLF